MNVASTTAALSALDRRDQRFKEKRLTERQKDEILIQNAAAEQGQTDCDNYILTNNYLSTDEESEIQQLLKQNASLLEVIGREPAPKPAETVRLVYENVNGLRAQLDGNDKLEKIRTILGDLEADAFAMTEHRNNLKHKHNRRNGLPQMFFSGDILVKGIWASNKHDNIESFLDKRSNEGGTGLVAFGELASHLNMEASGTDATGLGRWSFMEFRGAEGHSTMVVCGYVPCKNNKEDSSTSYQQHRRYFTNVEHREDEPRSRFLSDLTKILSHWKEQGKRLVVCLDANEDVYKDVIGRTLTDEEGLDMQESVLTASGERLTATHFRGSRPIDAVWTTRDIEVTNACAMPIGYGIGDHRMIVVDISKSSMLGEHTQSITRAGARRLTSTVPSCVRNYNRVLEELIERHRLQDKLLAAHSSSSDPAIIKKKLDQVDAEAKDYMLHAEKKCRKLRCGKIPFSPEASLWIKRTQFYRSLLRFKSGKGKRGNRGNLKRTARRCQIPFPFQLSTSEIAARLKECREKCNYFKVHGQRYRTQHLHRRLEQARDKQDSEAERRILQILSRERNKSFWNRINWSLGKKRSSSVGAVQVSNEHGGVTELTSQQEVQDAIWREVHQTRYHMAEEAPICQGKLRGEFGYNADTLAARQVLSGQYEFGEDFHEGTKRLMESIADIRQQVPIDSVDTIITREVWQQKWKKKKEQTASSVSKLHFGHYITGANSDCISDFHALKTSLALVHGIAIGRWSRGLCVMLEKVMGVKLINKLRAILLMEADFNASNKIVYGERMLDNARKYKLMPEEVFSEKNREATDGGIAKKLFFDIARQLRRPAALASVDAANCYDRVAHAISTMVFQAFGTPEKACKSMHSAIQDMQFFLRTAFGDSDKSVGARVELKTQGYMQGNGAAPAGWAVVSITIIHAHKKEGHGATFLCPITKLKKEVAGVLYVDDTDITHLDLTKVETTSEAHASLQRSLDSWSQLLIASGGALKPAKCFYYLMSYVWDRKGRWSYAKNEGNPEYEIKVDLPDGTSEAIEHLSVNECRITLGMSSCPSGKVDATLAKEKDEAVLDALGVMKEKALIWVNQAKNSGLSPRDIHFSVDKKFWPKIKYGICANDSPYDDIIQAMHKPYYILCPLGGVVRSAKRELRFLDAGFYGVGFPHWGAEAIVESVNKVLTHYGTQSLLGVQYQMSLELLTIELGISTQPFLADYNKYHSWVTDCTLKEMWGRLHRFGLKLRLGNLLVKSPREGDRWFMAACEEAGFSPKECEILNMIRLHQQVVYESDVFAADGRHIDPTYLRLRPKNESWSHWLFPLQKIPPSYLSLWKQALQQLAPGGRRPRNLGKCTSAGHKIWRWKYSSAQDTLVYSHPDGSSSYYVRDCSDRSTRQTRYHPSDMEVDIEEGGLDHLGTITENTDGSVSILSLIKTFSPPPTPSSFLDVLQEWGCSWLWQNMRMSNSVGQGVNLESSDGGAWLLDAIRDNSLVAVTDGSYIRSIHPHLCSAAAILECSKGRGRLVLSFSEKCLQANAYRGELLGLMAVHLLLLSFNKTTPNLTGSTHIYSDCLGALNKVENLPPGRIPSRCRHSDILKNILINCKSLSFSVLYSHVYAHQADYKDFDDLDRIAQLNEGCDVAAKREIVESSIEDNLTQRSFPLEPMSLFVHGVKITTESGPTIRFAIHLQEAKSVFEQQKVLNGEQFDLVDWFHVHKCLHKVPKMFSIFACKQVFNLAGTFSNLHKRGEPSVESPICPFCTQTRETAGHVLLCPEAGRVQMLHTLSSELLNWLNSQNAPRDLIYLIVKYIRGRGTESMTDICYRLPPVYRAFAVAQDTIGWRRFMEGMVAKELCALLGLVDFQDDSTVDISTFICDLVQKLLETTHGMWIYRNLTIHDSLSGVFANERKERLMDAIEEQLLEGPESLREEDKWLLEVDLDDISGVTTGEKEVYWLLAVQAARERFRQEHYSRSTRRNTTTGDG